jgi:hypothetical protein
MLFTSNLDYYSSTPQAKLYLKSQTKPIKKLIGNPNKLELTRNHPFSNFNSISYGILGTNVQTTDFVLNFKRLRFFPLARPKYSGETIFTTSLGCISKFLNKGKSHIKKKAVFLLSAVLLRRILLYSGLSDMHLTISRTPQYFQEIMNQIHNPSKSLYAHPFALNKVVDESADRIQTFDFKYVSFVSTKSHGYIK